MKRITYTIDVEVRRVLRMTVTVEKPASLHRMRDFGGELKAIYDEAVENARAPNRGEVMSVTFEAVPHSHNLISERDIPDGGEEEESL